MPSRNLETPFSGVHVKASHSANDAEHIGFLPSCTENRTDSPETGAGVFVIVLTVAARDASDDSFLSPLAALEHWVGLLQDDVKGTQARSGLSVFTYRQSRPPCPPRGMWGVHTSPPEIKGPDYLMVLQATGDGWMYFTDPKKGKYCATAAYRHNYVKGPII